MKLPNDIIDEILSYGDVDVTQKYEGVLLQLNFYIKEFNYHRKKPNNVWSTYADYEYKIYALTKSKIKKYILKISKKSRVFINTDDHFLSTFNTSSCKNIITFSRRCPTEAGSRPTARRHASPSREHRCGKWIRRKNHNARTTLLRRFLTKAPSRDRR